MSTRLVAGYLAIMLLGYGGSARASRYCRRHCGAAISACEETGGRHGVCRRDTLRRCKRDRTVCSFTTTTFTAVTRRCIVFSAAQPTLQ